MNNHVGTEEENGILEKYHSGWTRSRIAGHFRRDPYTITTVLERHGIAPYSSTKLELRSPKTIEEIKTLYDQGVCVEEIAKKIGCHVTTLTSRIFKECGIKLRPHRAKPKHVESRFRLSEAEREQICRRYSDGHTMEAIGSDFGISLSLISKVVHEARLPIHDISHNSPAGESSPRWTGGKYLNKSTGYVYMRMRNHPMASKWGYVPEHRYVMEQHLLETKPDHPALENGVLSRKWVIHHINENKSDNRIENLMLKEPPSHSSHHLEGSWLRYKRENVALKLEIAKLRQLVERYGLQAREANK
jgi:transposase